jgi:hypothetical protein
MAISLTSLVRMKERKSAARKVPRKIIVKSLSPGNGAA